MLKKEVLESYLLILPLLILLSVFILYPVLANIFLSFFKWKGMGKPVFTGISNFRDMFSDVKFQASIKNTLILLLYIPLGTIVPLFLSAFLREGIKGWSIYKAVIYLPNVLGYVIIGLIFSIIFRKTGPVNSFFRALNLDSLDLDWLNKSSLAINSVGLVYGVWIRLGFGCIYFLAAMSGIDQSLYEAIRLEGANWLQTFRHITLPSIRFSIEFWIVFSFIEMIARAFPFIYTFTRGGPGFGTFTLEYGIYDAGFVAFKMGYASAWSCVLFVFCSVIAVFQVKLMRKNADA